MTTSPVQFLKETYLKPLGITPGELADALGVREIEVRYWLECCNEVTYDQAFMLDKLFPYTTATQWLDLQREYVISQLQLDTVFQEKLRGVTDNPVWRRNLSF